MISLLHVGGGIGAAVGDVLDALYDRISAGGQVLIDDVGDEACADAVRAFRERRGLGDRTERISWSGLGWRKSEEATGTPTASASGGVPARAPLAPPVPTDAKDLTVVVVVYDMAREAERTLHSLSRTYQRGIDDLDYEVIVVENGSPAGHAPRGRAGRGLRLRVPLRGPRSRRHAIADDCAQRGDPNRSRSGVRAA